MDVSQPLLSIGELHRQGCRIVLGKNSYLCAEGQNLLRMPMFIIPLLSVGNMTYLEAIVLSTTSADL
eukprot:15736020-Heterocapsa_arctica.AAC.1